MTHKFKEGELVRMTIAYKNMMAGGSADHIREFGMCIGRVVKVPNTNNPFESREYDVRWYPSDLMFGYSDSDLESVDLSQELFNNPLINPKS